MVSGTYEALKSGGPQRLNKVNFAWQKSNSYGEVVKSGPPAPCSYAHEWYSVNF